MRAPFCNDSPDLSPEEKGVICRESERKIQSIDKTLARSHTSKTAVFGVCLEQLMGTSTQVTPQIPFILSRLCRYIETHGLRFKNLFLEGDMKGVETLKGEFSENGDASLETVHDIASTSKLLLVFFEELPEPVIPRSAQLDFGNMEKLPSTSSNSISHLKKCVEKLPDFSYQVVKYLSQFLLRVACYEEYNGMGYDNLAVLFGPILFRSNNPTYITQQKNIMKLFLQNYHDIFEDFNTSVYKDPLKSSKGSKQLSCPSAVMPILPLSPLSVFIPSMESSTDRNMLETVPALLMEGPANGIKVNVKPLNTENIGVGVTRKRKERRFSGEESQPRSSSEERPNTNGLLPLENVEVMRRCNSHEEVTEDVKIDCEMNSPSNLTVDKRGAPHLLDSYLSDTMELVVNEKNHSPHPPNAKRREVETSYSIRESSDEWQCQPSKCSKKLSISDMPLCRDSQQHPTAEFSDKNTMDCDATEEQGIVNEEFLASKSVIPRSDYCPVPNVENDREDSESDSSSLSLSWSMLFEDSEPVRSSLWSNENQDEALLSPSVHELRSTNYYEAPLSPSAFRSYLSHRGPHLDPSVPPSPPVEQEDFANKLVENSGISDSIKQLTKKMHSIKRRIKKFDEKFEAEFGYKPSHAEKSNNVEAKKLLNDLHKAKKELKALKEESQLEQVSPVSVDWHANHVLGDTTNHFLREDSRDITKPPIEVSLEATLKSLSDERKFAHRPELIDDMTNEQVRDEKVSIQKALLHLESVHGKPYSKNERDSIRPLYDRYRSIKKLARSTSFPGSVLKKKDLYGELQPILEHETMEFPSREVRTEKEVINKEVEPEKTEVIAEGKLAEETTRTVEKKSAPTPCFLTMKYDNSNFHELPLSELIFQLQKVKSEKRHLRKILKEFETEFLRLNGRKVQKEDKAPVDTLYNEYKHVKARLKLLEALLSKHDQHQLM